MAKTKRTPKYKESRWGIKNTTLTDLPPEILINIIKKLQIKPLCCLQCDSKYWFRRIDCSTKSFCLASKTLLNVATEVVAETPLLMRLVRCTRSGLIHYNKPDTVTALQLLRHDGKGNVLAFEILSMADQHNYNVHFVFNNLFCFKHVHDDKPCFLINPFRGEILELPMSTPKGTKDGTISKVVFGMGYDKLTGILKIIRVSRIDYHHNDRVGLVAELLVLGTSLWQEIPYVLPYWNLVCMNNVCAYGDNHWLCSGFMEKGIEDLCDINPKEGMCIMVSFDFTEQVFNLTPLPMLQSSDTFLHLITLRGSIAIVDTSYSNKIEIWVMKDYSRKQWTLDYTINTFELGLLLPIPFVVCEWEHGLFFTQESGDVSFFFDFRRPTHLSTAGTGYRLCLRAFSMKGSLISLKDYGNLVDAFECKF